MAGPVFVTLCEYATTHLDGTFSAVRGGIVTWSVAELPLQLQMWAVVHVDPGALPPGEYDVSLETISPMGQSAGRMSSVKLTIRNPALPALFTLPVTASIQSSGNAIVRVRVGDLPPGETTLAVTMQPKEIQ